MLASKIQGDKMMKKLLCALMSVMIFFCAAGIIVRIKNVEAKKTSEEVLLKEYVEKVKEIEVPKHEYGEETSHNQVNEGLVVHILYPTTKIPELDSAMETWNKETVALYEKELEEVDGKQEAELTVEYESHVYNDKLIGVKLMGIHHASYMAHPTDIVATFNANLNTMKMLQLEDILLPGGYDKLLELVVQDAGIEEKYVDEYLLNHWVIKKEGLEITLERGTYLPSSEGTKVFSYPYDKLTDIFKMPENRTVDPNKPMVALSFDDGPSKHTDRLLDIFAKNGGKGTFFVVGNLIEGKEETLKRIALEQHEIGNHSWSHRQFTKLGTEELTDQIMNTKAKIYEVTGVNTNLVRPPYGSFNDHTKSVASYLGVSLVNWSLDTLDWKSKNADAVYQEIISNVKDGDIILCHDLHKTTVDAMERVIPDLIAKGYQLVTVSELLSQEGSKIEAGKVYFNMM